MILKLLGILDISAVACLFLFKYGLVPELVLIAAVIYLMAKGIMFFRNIVSLLDVGTAIVFALALLGVYNILTWLAVLWVLQKAVFSLLG
ncbi:hypothetical protein FJZ53_02730 [Candidatus Woesearchaeota archaeon]|nr:hypothetical protein [Candidatus Woesearchaeota archaeon]